MTGSQPRVLVVDNDAGVLKSLELLLSADCEVTVCDDLRQALDVATSTPFDVIITDCKMQHMTGAGDLVMVLAKPFEPARLLKNKMFNPQIGRGGRGGRLPSPA